MRLLKFSDTDGYHFTKSFTNDEAIPPYAILSYTWGADGDEVTFNDFLSGNSVHKPGYEKIQFCAEQARADRCYAYLSDVSTAQRKMDGDACGWEATFRRSKWFTRGWTLQELLTPRTVEFFSQQRKRLGNKDSLRQLIYEITGIPEAALQGELLSQFSVNDRLSWIEHRETRREEDKAYSLLGIFGVYMPPIYSEGIGRAFSRLQDEIKKLEECTRDLHVTDPRRDKARIEETKGGLLEESRLLWIKGDPGKGKTMLLCRIANELTGLTTKTALLSYFFCQATDSRINSATAVLRGLLYMLVHQQPSLVSHVRKKHDHAGKALFEDANAWVALSKIFANVLRDPSLNSIYLIIDALDKCAAGLPKLLDFIVQTSSLVCQNLSDIPRWKVLAKLEAFPPGLDALYTRMMQHISSSDDANLYKRILALIAIVYRPVTLDELTYLCEPLEDMADDLASVQQIVGLCDFLCTKAVSNIFPSGIKEAHRAIFLRSLRVMSKTLQRDIYGLGALGYPAAQVEKPDPDPLAASRYSCIYWINHLFDWNHGCSAHDMVPLQDQGPVDNFLRTKYLYWLEALSLCKSMPKGVVSIAKLKTLMKGRADAGELIVLIQDARRFIIVYKLAIESSPLQAYSSALMFSPASSLVRRLFEEEEPHSWVYSVAYSPDSARLASASYDGTVKIWDANSGECLSTLEGHSSSVRSVAFSYDSARLASASDDGTLKIWDLSSGECLSTLEGHSSSVRSVAFSYDSARLASASGDSTVKIWDASSGECLSTLEGHSSSVSGECLSTLEGHSSWVYSVAFSHNSARLASASDDRTLKIWDLSSGECLSTLEGHSSWVYSVTFSNNSARLASASDDGTVKIWDASSGEYLSTLEGHSSSVRSVAFSYDSARLASASDDRTLKIWDLSSGECLQTLTVEKALGRIWFDITGSCLHTDIGPIEISVSLGLPSSPLSNQKSQNPQYQGLALSVDGVWIKYNSENLVWLPSEYRPACSAVSGETIGVGVGSGRVWICNVHYIVPSGTGGFT
ncbi:hypothetical protein CC78DRAFT_621216 [Lojkania enalia]|uniref:Mitochondrial division protein 1 n=1 Tax=Lojkania enalia TaxID=147567 RepID=A0A9P4K343_9PLEO|nr:hypothetical protein CC78DRAFT_621216 [Didymosphaeria enalia]